MTRPKKIVPLAELLADANAIADELAANLSPKAWARVDLESLDSVRLARTRSATRPETAREAPDELPELGPDSKVMPETIDAQEGSQASASAGAS